MASNSFSSHKLLIAYDGSSFLGWQKTKLGPTVQGALEEALSIILQEKVDLEGSSRTDRGVHSLGQVASFQSQKKISSYAALKRGLNAKLPLSIRVLQAEEAPLGFHPTLDATFKEYRYHIVRKPLPHQRLYSWYCPFPLDLDKMREAASFFLGEHDFAAFTNVKRTEPYENTIRRLDRFDIIDGEMLTMHLTGKQFLYKMVRNLVGTTLYVGAGKIALEDLPHILHNKDRRAAGVTAPAHGLWLHNITYRDYATEK